MIREMKLEDYEEVKELFYEVHNLHLENRPDIYIDGNPLPLKYFEELLNDKENLNYAYILDNKVVGILTADIKTTMDNYIIKARKICFIESLGVKENYQHQGIGRKLYEYLKNEVKSKNIDAIELNVWGFNENAIRFYESLGMNIKNIKYEDTNL